MQSDMRVGNPSVLPLAAILSFIVGVLIGCSHCPCPPSKIIHQPVEYKSEYDRQNAINKALATVWSAAARRGAHYYHTRGAAVLVECEIGKEAKWLTATHLWESFKANRALIVYRGEPSFFVRPSIQSRAISRRWIAVTIDRYISASYEDIALIKSVDKMAQCSSITELAQAEPKRGAILWSIGNPMDTEGNITEGILSSHRQIAKILTTFKQYRADMAIGPGNSGGGLFNNRGELVGIVTETRTVSIFEWGKTQQQGSTIATALPHLRTFLRR
jgi:hypothetical protein